MMYAELYKLAHDVAAFVVPQEYGMTAREKAEVGRKIGGLLIKKVAMATIPSNQRGGGGSGANSWWRLASICLVCNGLG
jgi:hypothetical protein